MGTEAPELPLTIVSGQFPVDPNSYDPELYRQYLEAYYASFQQQQYEQQESGGGGDSGGGAPADQEELEEVIVTGERVPVKELTNDELLQLGTDDAVEELDRRRDQVCDGDECWRQDWYQRGAPIGLEQGGLIEAFMPPPPPVYLPTIIETIIPVLAPLALPFLLLFPSPTAPRELDEAPLRPPPRPPREPNIPDYFIDPPNWDDLIRDPFDPGIDFTPGVRLFPFPLEDDFVQAKPISDLPDLVGVIPDLEIPLFGPIEVPDYDYIANPTRSPEPGRRTAPVGDPRSVPNPFSDPFGWPLPFGVPGTDPFSPTAPEVFPEPRTIADPVTGPGSPIGEPVRIGDPIEGSPTPGLDPFPLTAFAPDFAQPDVDTCQCEGGGKKKKKRKKKPREVCYRGTYIETSRSLKKTRKEEVPCQ